MSKLIKYRFLFLSHSLFISFSWSQSTILDITTHSDIVNDSDNSVGSYPSQRHCCFYNETVENISNITISNFTITNTLIGIDGTALSLSSLITRRGDSYGHLSW